MELMTPGEAITINTLAELRRIRAEVQRMRAEDYQSALFACRDRCKALDLENTKLIQRVGSLEAQLEDCRDRLKAQLEEDADRMNYLLGLEPRWELHSHAPDYRFELIHKNRVIAEHLDLRSLIDTARRTFITKGCK